MNKPVRGGADQDAPRETCRIDPALLQSYISQTSGAPSEMPVDPSAEISVKPSAGPSVGLPKSAAPLIPEPPMPASSEAASVSQGHLVGWPRGADRPAKAPVVVPAASSIHPGVWVLLSVVLFIGGTFGVLQALRPDLVNGLVDSVFFDEGLDLPQDVRIYYHKAMNGDAAAMRMLGVMYLNGLNVKKDRKEAIRWYRKAARAGSVAAIRELREMGLEP